MGSRKRMRNKEILNSKDKKKKRRIWEGICPPLLGPILFSTQSSWPDIAYQQDLLVTKLSHTCIIDENKHITDIYVTIIGIMVVQTC